MFITVTAHGAVERFCATPNNLQAAIDCTGHRDWTARAFCEFCKAEAADGQRVRLLEKDDVHSLLLLVSHAAQRADFSAYSIVSLFTKTLCVRLVFMPPAQPF